MADLFVSSFGPALGSGRALRTYTCVRAMALLGPVDLAYLPHGANEPSAEYQAIEGVSFHRIEPSRPLSRALAYGGLLLRGVPDDVARGVVPAVGEVATRLADRPGRGRVVAGDDFAALAMWHLARRRPVIYNAHNVESERQATFYGRALMRSFERRLLAHVDEAWMVSQRDLELARNLSPGAKLRYVPNVVDVRGIRPVRSLPRENRIIMVADFSYEPNLKGLDFFLGEVLPLVRLQIPAVRVVLVGRGLDGRRLPMDVEQRGFVDELRPVYESADCVVVPLTEGAGTPLKFIEALAYGVPVVATPLAARGLAVEAGLHFRLGEDARSFAAAVVETLRDDSLEIGRLGRRLAESEYSIEALAERIAA